MDLSWILDKEWGLRGKKGTFSSRPLKKEGRRKPDHSLIYATRKIQKFNKSEKDMASTVPLPLGITSNFVSSR